MAATERDMLYRAKFVDDVTPAHDAMIERAISGSGRMGAAEKAWNNEIQQVRRSILEQRDALVLRKEALDDPSMQRAIAETRKLQEEIKALTKAEAAGNETAKLTARSRRELIVLAHELSQGQYKSFGGSLMVLEEGQGGIVGAVKAATEMLGGPYVVAAGAATIATIGIGAALWKASEHAAENFHKMSMLAATYGTDAQTMMGFQQLATGTGITVAQLGESFSRFTVNLTNHRKELEAVGITARDPVEAFEQLMDVAKRTSDPLARSSIMTQALGEEWRKLAPLLMKGGDAARDAIKEMAIPEGVQENYRRASEAQIEIDKNFNLIKEHAGESLSGVRAWFKEVESGLARIAAHDGLIAALGSLTSRGRLFNAAEERKAAESKNPTDFYAGFGVAGVLTEKQQQALDWARKQNSKASLENELAEVRKEFQEKASEFEKGSANYRIIMDAELAKEDEIRKKWAKKKTPGETEEERLRKHDVASQANVVTNFDGSVTLRSGIEWKTQDDPEHVRNRQGAERSREAREKKELEDTQKMRANAQKIRMDWESALIEKKRQAHDEEMKLIRERFDVGQKLASDQVYKMLQGEFTIRGAVNATKDVMFRAFADTTTKWIEEQLIKMVFSKGAQAEETASAVAQASVVGAAWAAPSMATSIATFGGSTATGSAAWFTAMTAAQGYSVMPHARGGAVFGPVSASREEAFAPFVPGRIVPSYNSTTNHNTTNAQSITIHVHGGDEKTILRTLRKAGINGAGVSRS